MLKDIHIIAPFLLANGGDWHAIDLYLQYSKSHRVTLWSHQPAHPDLKSKYPIQEIKPYSGQTPNLGTLIICGARTEIGRWYENAHFEKVVLIHNLLSPSALYKSLNRLTMNGKRQIEIHYMSELVKKFAGLTGKVTYHIPPNKRFKPKIKTVFDQATTFTVGRISSDVLAKHHHSDPKVYQTLANLGMQVRIIGGTCLTPWLNHHHNISLLPAVAQSKVAASYSELDCFYYRVPSSVKEAYGLVVIEAMLSGLPVVCHRDGGYAEVIQHGVNGFVFDDTDEAIEIITSLKNNTNLRKQIGSNAQKIAYSAIDY